MDVILFLIFQDILKRTEACLLDLPIESKPWSFVTRHLFFPLKYLFLGLGDFFKPTGNWALMSVGFLMLVAFFSNNSNLNKEYTLLLMYISLFLPMVLVIFAVPSTYINSGINNNKIIKIEKFIEDSDLKTIEEIELLEDFVLHSNDRISSRASFYRWILGFSWALYILIFNLEIRLMLKAEEIDLLKKVGDNIVEFAFSLYLAAAVLIIINGYKRASEILIKSIQFSCINRKHSLLQAIKKGSPSIDSQMCQLAHRQE